MKKLLAAAAAVIMTLSMSGCGDKPDEKIEYKTITLNEEITKPISDYFNGYENSDPDSVIISYIPQKVIDKYKAENKYDDELVESIMKDIEATLEHYGDDLELKATSSFTGSPMDENSIICAENYLAIVYQELDMTFEVTEGYSVTFDYSISGENNSLDGVQDACLVKPENDDWKLLFVDIETLNLYNGTELTLGGNGTPTEASEAE